MPTRIILPKSEKPEKKRIAAYCRVSSSSEEQLHSYAAQVKFYTEMLSADESCKFVGVYADEGITGTSAKKRPQFMAMIEDCRAGKIDAIITKSVSRFGRNTVDTLSYTRELKALGIDVYFEKENLHSISPEGELLLTLMAAFAESESVSMSENIKWGKRKRYAKGDTGSIPVRNIYGFDRDADGNIIVIEDEIKVVQRIFREFMVGSNCAIIADGLNADGIPTPLGGRKWVNRVVMNILENEKYCGDCLFQKRFKVSPITKQQVNNKGEFPQYLLEGEFPKAVDKRLWELVQLERKRRRENCADMPSPDYPFRGKIFCATCGRPMLQQSIKTYGGKWLMYWRCAHFITRCRKADDKPCTDARIPFDRPSQVFRQAWNLMVSKKTRYQATLKRVADENEDPLVRYRAKELGELLDETGRLDSFDYYTFIRTVDRMEVSTGGKVAVIFLAGVRITI